MDWGNSFESFENDKIYTFLKILQCDFVHTFSTFLILLRIQLLESTY